MSDTGSRYIRIIIMALLLWFILPETGYVTVFCFGLIFITLELLPQVIDYKMNKKIEEVIELFVQIAKEQLDESTK